MYINTYTYMYSFPIEQVSEMTNRKKFQNIRPHFTILIKLQATPKRNAKLKANRLLFPKT